jgi:hypothetical protein
MEEDLRRRPALALPLSGQAAAAVTAGDFW